MASHPVEIVLITGANTGLGFEVAKKLLRDHPNRFHVLIGCRTLSKGEAAVRDLQTQGLTAAEPLHMDVTSDASIAAAAKAVEEKFGRLDVLHVNAGIAPDIDLLPAGAPLSELVATTMATNVAGAAQTVEAFVPLLRRSTILSSPPRLIFVSSALGSVSRVADVVDNRVWPAYSASKAALNMFVLWYWRRFPEWKVNATAPGFRPTALNHFGQGGGSIKPGRLEDGAVNAVRLTLLGPEGESGTFTATDDETGQHYTVPW